MKDEKTATAKVGGIMQNIDLGYACFQLATDYIYSDFS